MANWDGAGYSHISTLQRAMATASLAEVTVSGDEHVLDVGCGDGYVTRLIADRLPHGSVLGIDPSPRMIEAALNANDQQTNVTFSVADVTSMSFDHEFDLVVSFNALHWVREQNLAYWNISGALRQTGRALVQFVCAGDRPSVEDIAMAVAAEPRWSPMFTGFIKPFLHLDPNELTSIAASAGLDVTAQAVVDREWDFGSREEFVKWCTVGFADWTARLSATEVPEFVDEVASRYQAIVGSPGLFRFLQLRAELRPQSSRLQ